MRLSSRVADLQPSPIREILSVISRPGMISFAGGLPAPETFAQLDANIPRDVLQYGASEGEPALRERIAQELRLLGLQCGADQVLILSGSQQGIDLIAKLFVDRDTPVAVESPTYLAALQVFRFFGAMMLPFDVDALRVDMFAEMLPALVYAIPTFQNPTGHCYSTSQRQALAEACDQANVPLFEDDPYRDLFYDACDRKPVCSLLRRSAWIYQSSFSKSFAPGIRLGFLAASKDLITPLVRLKQAADLHSNRISQWWALQYLENPDRKQQLSKLAAIYKAKRDHFDKLLHQYFGDLATWQTPSGGLFFWLTLKRKIDTRQLLPLAIEQDVAFMPGEPFYPEPVEASGTLRLNFSHASAEEAGRGLQILSGLIRQAV
ncbi:MAG: PLP-dependent aminotransferase family protein [Steroidobacter sp.]